MDKIHKRKGLSGLWDKVKEAIRSAFIWTLRQLRDILLGPVIFAVLLFIGLSAIYDLKTAWRYVMNLLTSSVLMMIILVTVIVALYIQYHLSRAIKGQEKKYLRNIYLAGYLLLAFAIWYFAFNGAMAKFNIEIPAFLSPTPSPTITPSSTPTETNTPTHTPTPASVSELKICKQPETQFPCRYYIRDGDIGSTIAEKVYGKDHIDQAGRIVELYRDENGEIMTIITGNEIVIPDWNIPLDEQYYEYYFQIIPNPIRKCDARFWFPCWYVSDGEPLDILIGLPDPDMDETCFLQANRSTYNTRTRNTEIKAIGEGVIFVYPVCQ